jgi:hypothetical protein
VRQAQWRRAFFIWLGGVAPPGRSVNMGVELDGLPKRQWLHDKLQPLRNAG